MTELCFAIFQFYIRYAIVLHGNVFPHYGLKLHIVSFKYHSISLPSITNLKKIFLKFIPVVCNHKMYFWLPKVFYDGHNCLRLLHRPFNQTSIFVDWWCQPYKMSPFYLFTQYIKYRIKYSRFQGARFIKFSPNNTNK